MLKYEQWLQQAESLKGQIEDFLRVTNYFDQEQVYIPDMIPSADTLYVQEQLSRFCHELEEAYYQMKRMNAKVVKQGKLRLGANGRYWLDNEELPCGRSVELLYDDGTSVGNIPSWHAGRIDHDGSKYYFTGKRSMKLEGMTARMKQHL